MTTSMVEETSPLEKRIQALLALVADGREAGDVAAAFEVSRRPVRWRTLYRKKQPLS